MRLELLSPPLLVAVDRHPALLLARRGDRSYVQVRRACGLNHLCWVPATEVGTADQADAAQTPLPATRFGLPRADR